MHHPTPHTPARDLHRTKSIGTALALASLMTAPLFAQTTLTWDTTSGDGATVTAGAGTWSTTDTNWNNGTTNVAWTTTSPTVLSNTARFAGSDGTYAISLASAVSVHQLTFDADGYTISSDVARNISLATTATPASSGLISVASGKTAEIGTNVTLRRGSAGVTSDMTLQSGGTLRISGSLLQVNSNNFSIRDGSSLVIASGGTGTFTNSVVVGSAGTGSSLVVNGGQATMSATAGNLVLANLSGQTASASLTVSSSGSLLMTGTTATAGVRFGSTTGNAATNVTAEVNLDSGGTLQTNRFFEGSATGTINSTVNFNGGILKVGASPNATFLGVDSTTVKTGGARIDTNGKTVSLANAFNTDLVSTGGGFEKLGPGQLTLTGSSNFTGETKVTAGTLVLGTGGSIASSSGVNVAAGATFTNGTGASFSKAFTVTEGALLSGAITSTTFTYNATLSDSVTAVNLGSNFTKDGTLNFLLSEITAGDYTLFTGTSIFGSFTTVQVGGVPLVPALGVFSKTIGAFSYTYTDSLNLLQISAIPEPARVAALTALCALAATALLRRRQAR